MNQTEGVALAQKINAVLPEDFAIFRYEMAAWDGFLYAEIGIHHYDDGVMGPNIEIVVSDHRDESFFGPRVQFTLHYRGEEWGDGRRSIPVAEAVAAMNDYVDEFIREELI